jgi:hypothetical protein
MSSRRRLFTISTVFFLASVSLAVAQAPAPATVSSDPLDAVRTRFAADSRLTVFDVITEPQADGILVRGEVESAAARDAVLEALRGSGQTRVADRITVLPDPSLGGLVHGIVRVSVANVRGRPAHAAELVTQALMGWPVRVLKSESGWHLVHTDPDGYLGWIEDLQLTRVTSDDRQRWEDALRYVVTTPYAVVRDGPDADALPVTDLVVGALVQRAGSASTWAQVQLPDGRRGYVRADEIEEYSAWRATRAATAASVERVARQFMGVPYLWGGTSAKGFDCSGFAKIVFRLHGIELPRDADQQAREGADVSIEDGLGRLKPGDLLFFGTAASGEQPERITHVAIHVGNLAFIHASGLVRMNSLDPAAPIYSESLRNRLVRVRRLLPETGPPPSGGR